MEKYWNTNGILKLPGGKIAFMDCMICSSCGDGRQVQSTVNGVITTFVGAHYQVEGGMTVKYYLAGGQRIAMRTPNNSVSYLLSDHLGSTSLTTNSTGTVTSEMRYTACPLRYTAGVLREGETRFTNGTSPSNYRYTGQRQEASFGLYFYNARWYDSALGRFAQADTIVPGGVQGLDRYAYVNNNAVRYIDPSGHMRTEGDLTEPTPIPEPTPENPDDPTRLTVPSENGVGSGTEMKEVYDRLVAMCEAGTYSHPFCFGGLTVREFTIIILSNELSPLGLEGGVSTENWGKLITAAKNWFGDSCTQHEAFKNPCNGPTANAIFNWLGENFQSAQSLFPEGVTPTEEYPQIRALATAMTDAILTMGQPPYSHPFDALVHWANKSYYLEEYGTVPLDYYIVLGGGDTFYVVSYYEESRMCGWV
ncbi:MAG: RHS repeat-associated core domain-containing protein, partial [Chloroflexota bacterium]